MINFPERNGVGRSKRHRRTDEVTGPDQDSGWETPTGNVLSGLLTAQLAAQWGPSSTFGRAALAVTTTGYVAVAWQICKSRR
ncbi:hypothetical protein [Streptacidiphilus sp. P02-A3a]|uniref:hypothetical protein n=1 Tax=Streptacidiphilus sp. P02-A3a TaxID=2704468 RepID=UPI0015FB362A|nr:hypothetical protein [Streptacidiphilus sp. P02-A3a]QMU69348.1 hypothetical protein GXP74_14960 [Streptacidiphilus sp. P02-A3a]